MNADYKHVATIYEDAKRNGFKIAHFNTNTRHNEKGYYEYVEVTYIVPVVPESEKPQPKQPVEVKQPEAAEAVQENNEIKKEEVINNEV